MPEHTELPWEVNTEAGPRLREVFAGHVLICDCGATNVEMPDEEIQANAELIVLAVNHHAELVRFLKLLRSEDFVSTEEIGKADELLRKLGA